MMLGGFVKVSIYLLASCKGIAAIFGYKEYRFLATPAALLLIVGAMVFHKSILDFTEWNNEAWPYITFLFQAILPIVALCICEIKKTPKGKNQG